METVLDLLLIRFAVIVAGAVILGLLLFATVLSVRRRGGGDQIPRYVKEATRVTIACLGNDPGCRPYGSRRRHWIVGAVIRAAARKLEDDRRNSGKQVNDQ